VKKLSSLLLTLYALGGVVFLLIAGMILAQVKPYSAAMPAMDQALIRLWLPTALSGGPASALLGCWFLALCGAVGLLVANLVACTITRLLPRLSAGQVNGGRLHSWLLLLAHALMVVILLGHLSQMSLGFKRENLKLPAGQATELPGGLSVKVDQVVFQDDPALLNLNYRQGRRAHTRDAFHREKNLARVSLWQGGQRQGGGALRILEPLLADDLRITLSDFYRQDTGGPPQVGAVLTITRNPLTRFFFAAYLAWIAVYLSLAARAFVRGPKTINNRTGDQS